jgi:hypothetical protein
VKVKHILFTDYILKPCGFQTFHCMTVPCELFEGLYPPVSDLKRGVATVMCWESAMSSIFWDLEN